MIAVKKLRQKRRSFLLFLYGAQSAVGDSEMVLTVKNHAGFSINSTHNFRFQLRRCFHLKGAVRDREMQEQKERAP